MEDKQTVTLKGVSRSRNTPKNKEVNAQPFVSVLMPVFNGTKFLEECIESVLTQDYENWEYALVNNHSTDNSLQTMQEYADRDKRIHIHNKKDFLPQMENLNHVFRQISSKSKYCKVVYANDWLFPECLTKMVAVAEEYPSVGIVSSSRLDENSGNLDGLPYLSYYNDSKEVARKYLKYGASKFGSPTSLLIRSDLIRRRGKVYEESHMATDTTACIDMLQESDFGFVHEVLTFSRRHDMGITNTKAKESYLFMYAKLFFPLTYGPIFLSDDKLEKSLTFEINKYYILFARNLFGSKLIKEFNRQRKILDNLKLEFKTGRFIKNFVREIGIQLFNVFGIKLEKA